MKEYYRKRLNKIRLRFPQIRKIISLFLFFIFLFLSQTKRLAYTFMIRLKLSFENVLLNKETSQGKYTCHLIF